MAVVWLGLVAACAQPPLPKDHFYRLQVAAPSIVMAAPRLDGTLEIGRFIADGLTAGRPIVYSSEGNTQELQEYSYHFWTETPTVMLRDALVDYLRQAKAAKAIVTPEMRVPANFVISGKIRRLEQVIGTPTRGLVKLELALRQTKGDKLLFLNTYEVKVEATNNSVSAAISAVNKAVSRVFAKYVDDISKN